jgi:hypothetical protein
VLLIVAATYLLCGFTLGLMVHAIADARRAKRRLAGIEAKAAGMTISEDR